MSNDDDTRPAKLSARHSFKSDDQGASDSAASKPSVDTRSLNDTVLSPADRRPVAGPLPISVAEIPPGALSRGSGLGRYLVIDRIASGGMGEVYAAYDPSLDRKVALKVLLPELSEGQTGERAGARLLREAQALARLSHPNVVSVHDFGEDQGKVFIAMEFIEGQDLAAWTAHPKPWPEVVALFVEAGRGLAAAHEVGLVHRDFKPRNVLIGKTGRVCVADFGLARPVTTIRPQVTSSHNSLLELELTGKAGGLLGTLAYMAPEQLRCEPATPLSDQFAFCISLYQTLYGRRPFNANEVDALLEQMRKTPGAVLKSDVPAWLQAVIARGLAFDPKDRFPSMTALLAALTEDPKKARRRRLGVTAALGLVVASSLSFGAYRQHRAQLCSGSEARLAGIWDPARQSTIQAAFAKTGVPFASDAWNQVKQVLDAYSTSWTTMAKQACEDARIHGVETEEAYAMRSRCLDQRMLALRALGDRLTEADRTMVEKAPSAAHSLPPIKACADLDALAALPKPPTDADGRARLERAHKAMAEAHADLDLGSLPKAIELTQQALDEAAPLHNRPLEAEAYYTQGLALSRKNEFSRAIELLHSSAEAAEAAQQDETLVKSWTLLVQVLSARSEFDQARRWGRYASAALEHVGENPGLEAQLHLAMSSLEQGQGHWEASLEEAQQALKLFRQSQAPDNSVLATALNMQGISQMKLGNYDQALASDAEGLQILERTVGPSHPEYAALLLNKGNVLHKMGRNAESADCELRAIEIRERSGDEDATLAGALNNLADVYKDQGQMAEAQKMFERSSALSEKIFGPEHMNVAVAQLNLCETLADEGHVAEGLTHCERSVAIMEKRYPTHPTLAIGLSLLGDCRLRLNQPDQALPLLERALALNPGTQGDPGQLGLLRFLLAKALVATHGDAARAKQLTDQAQEMLTRAGPASKDTLDELVRWRAKLASR
jgi:tetratricopeptide (TPR) repeat protein/predicted Ser/Thr protein kinase